jgi:hypothetical protein
MAARAPATDGSPSRAGIRPSPGSRSCAYRHDPAHPRGPEAGDGCHHRRREGGADQGRQRASARCPEQAARSDLRRRGSRHRQLGLGRLCPRSNIAADASSEGRRTGRRRRDPGTRCPKADHPHRDRARRTRSPEILAVAVEPPGRTIPTADQREPAKGTTSATASSTTTKARARKRRSRAACGRGDQPLRARDRARPHGRRSRRGDFRLPDRRLRHRL